MKIRVRDSDLRLRTSVRFYRLFAPLSQRAATDVLRAIHQSKGSTEPHTTRRKIGVGATRAIVDYTIVPYEDEPSFLQGTTLREQRLGFALFMQYKKYACVAISGQLSFPETSIAYIAERVGPDMVASTVDNAEKVQSLRCDSMAMGHGGIRSRSYAGDDLSMSLSSTAMSRQVAKSIRTRKDGASRNANPSTGLIARVGPRATLQGFVEWVIAEKEQMDVPAVQRAHGKPSFMDHFAQHNKRNNSPLGLEQTAV